MLLSQHIICTARSLACFAKRGVCHLAGGLAGSLGQGLHTRVVNQGVRNCARGGVPERRRALTKLNEHSQGL